MIATLTNSLELLTPGVLRVATEGNFAPFSMFDRDGELDGLEIRVMREVARRMNLEYEPVVVDWTEIVEGINANFYDISSASMDITEERRQLISFTDGWVQSGAQMLVRHDSPLVHCKDIRDHTVGVIVASTWVNLARSLGAKEVLTFANNPLATEALIRGEVAVIITDAIVSSYVINSLKLPVRALCRPLTKVQKGWAVKKGKVNLLRAVNTVLQEMVKDKTYQKLTSEMLGYCPYPEQPIRSSIN